MDRQTDRQRIAMARFTKAVAAFMHKKRIYKKKMTKVPIQ